jgi:hypothetical protein
MTSSMSSTSNALLFCNIYSNTTFTQIGSNSGSFTVQARCYGENETASLTTFTVTMVRDQQRNKNFIYSLDAINEFMSSQSNFNWENTPFINFYSPDSVSMLGSGGKLLLCGSTYTCNKLNTNSWYQSMTSNLASISAISYSQSDGNFPNYIQFYFTLNGWSQSTFPLSAPFLQFPNGTNGNYLYCPANTNSSGTLVSNQGSCLSSPYELGLL